MYRYQVVNEQNLSTYSNLFRQYQQECGFNYASAEVMRYLNHRLRSGDALMRMVTTDALQAQAMALILPSTSSLSMRPVWIISDLFTTPQNRRKGCAAFLIKAIEKEAAEQSVFSLRLQTSLSNEAAIALYKKMNFSKLDRLQGFSKVIAVEQP